LALVPSAPPGVRPPPPGVLTAIASGLAQALTGSELVLVTGQQRDYTRLLATPEYEAWLIAWAPAGGLQLHDHGGSRGAVQVARGRLVEAFIDADQDGRLRTRVLDAGSGVDVPARRVHEVWNPGPDPALSVHVYAPRLTTMDFYDLGADGSLIRAFTRHGDVVTLEQADGDGRA
jgi:hypothetical protein